MFDDHPTIEEVSFDVDEEDPDRYVFVQIRREGQDDFNGLGEDPEEPDEDHLNKVFELIAGRLRQPGSRSVPRVGHDFKASCGMFIDPGKKDRRCATTQG